MDTNFSKEEQTLIDSFEKHKNHSLQILFSIFKGNYFKLFLSAVFFFIKHTPAWALPIVIGKIVDVATTPEKHSAASIFIYIGIMILLIAQNVPMNYIHVKLYSKTIRNMEAEQRSSLTRKLQQLSITYHKEMQSGRLQSKIMRDVEAVEMMSTQAFTSILGIVINLIVAFVITIAKSRIVFGFFIITIPIAAVTIIAFRSKIRERNREFRKEMETTSAKVMEMVQLIPVTRAHSLEDSEIKKMDSQIGNVAKQGYLLDMVQAFFSSVSWSIFQLFQILCLGFTGYLAYTGEISVGDIVLYQTYFTTIVNSISAIVTLLPTITKGMESIDSIGDILLAHDVEDYRGKNKIKTVLGNYEFRDVSFKYGDAEKPVLNNFSLKVNQGETIAFVGGSGAGKTTIMNIIIGFMKISSGKIFIDGTDMSTLDLRTYRTHVAVVPQESILFSDTLRNNITYGIEGVSDTVLKKLLEDTNLTELVDSLPNGADTVIGENGGKLSGGQRQRISIARALIRNPDVVLLDEATSALDSISEKKIQESFSKLTQGKTTFIVAHRLSTIKNASKIVVLKDGCINEIGTYDELIEKKGEFYKMWEFQIG